MCYPSTILLTCSGIGALNGKTLDGSCLSFERAQESFIEKLKREREAKALGTTVPVADKNKSYNFAISDDQYNRQAPDRPSRQIQQIQESYEVWYFSQLM